MSHFRRVFSAAVFLALAPFVSASDARPILSEEVLRIEDDPSPVLRGETPNTDYVRRVILEENNPFAASNFLDDKADQEALKAVDPDLHARLFLRAAELKDLMGVLSGDEGSIRLSLLSRPNYSFCPDSTSLVVWAKKHMDYLGPKGIGKIEAAVWEWDTLNETQMKWVLGQGKALDWRKMDFSARHDLMRRWAKEEEAALLALNPSNQREMRGFDNRVAEISDILRRKEMSEVWKRQDLAHKASAALVEARAKVGRSADKRQKALIQEALSAAGPEERLDALSRLFEARGQTSRGVLAAAPPRQDQVFDDASRQIVGSMLKTALLKQTEGTLAGRDLQKFYGDRGVPLEVKIKVGNRDFLGWYTDGGDTLYFNEDFVQEYVKSRGASIDDLKRDPGLLTDLSRVMVGTFVHEAQHHRQDVWARDNKIGNGYQQGDEVEAFQTESLFLLEKLERDPGFRAFAEAEGRHSVLLKAGLSKARRMKEYGPDHFEYTVPNDHYPEVLSNEGVAWCSIVYHNDVAEMAERELARRDGLSAEQRSALDDAAPLKFRYGTREKFIDAMRAAGTASLKDFLAGAKDMAAKGPEVYSKIRERQEATSRVVVERLAMLDSGAGPSRRRAEPPPPMLSGALK